MILSLSWPTIMHFGCHDNAPPPLITGLSPVIRRGEMFNHISANVCKNLFYQCVSMCCRIFMRKVSVNILPELKPFTTRLCSYWLFRLREKLWMHNSMRIKFFSALFFFCIDPVGMFSIVMCWTTSILKIYASIRCQTTIPCFDMVKKKTGFLLSIFDWGTNITILLFILFNYQQSKDNVLRHSTHVEIFVRICMRYVFDKCVASAISASVWRRSFWRYSDKIFCEIEGLSKRSSSSVDSWPSLKRPCYP